MKRVFVSVLSGAAVLGISWLSGVDFDQRGEAMAASIAVALFFAVGVYVAYGVHE